MQKIDKNFQDIMQTLSRQRKRKIILQLSKGTFFLIGFVLSASLLTIFFDIPFQFDPAIRTGIVLAIFMIAAGIFIHQLVYPFLLYWRDKGKYSIQTTALEVGTHFGELHDDLINAIQVHQASKQNQERYSAGLISYSLATVRNRLSKMDFSGLYPLRKIKNSGSFAISPILIGILALGIFPSHFKSSLTHIFYPSVQFKPTPVEKIIVSPGNVNKVEGDSCSVSIKVVGTYKGSITLSFQEKTRDVLETKKLAVNSDQSYSYLFHNLRVPLTYFVQADDKVSPTYTIQVEKRPFVRKLKLRLNYPDYTDLPPRYLEDNVGDVTALLGTRVRMSLFTNKNLQRAKLVFANGKIKDLKLSGEEAITDYIIQQDTRYHIELEDQFGYSNLDPIDYSVRAIPDQFPIVDIISPGRDVDLNEEMSLPLSIEAEDDFGFSRLRLGYRIEASMAVPGLADTSYHYIELNMPEPRDTKIATDYLWDLIKLELMPEDVVYYFAEVWDNDKVSGPKRSISNVYTARFPSVYEIYNEVAQNQDDKVDQLEEVLNESKDLKEKLDNIERELNQQQQMDWLKKQDLEEIAQKQKNLQKSVDEIKKDLEEMVERLESNQMLSQETLQKYSELQQLFQDIMTPELQQALEQLRKSFEEFDEASLKQAIDKLQFSQENLLKNLERTINLFKRLRLEQKIDQAAKLTENLAQRQQMLNEQLKNTDSQDIASMMHQQQKLEEDATDLNNLLTKLDQELQQEARFKSPAMDSLLNEIQQAMQQMQMSQQTMKQGKMQQATRSGELSEENLWQMLQQLQQLKSSFNQAQKQEFTAEFNRASQDLLRLSQSQEELMQQTQGLSSTSPQLQQAAESQQELLQHLSGVTQQLYDLSQQTFFVTPEIGRAIGKSIASMQKSMQQLEQRNSRVAAAQQSNAIGGLNESILQIQKAMQYMKGSASAVGFEEFMKRLQQMSGKQQGINQQTLQLGMQQGQMTLEQQAAISRLAAEQNSLKKSMEQLQKEFGNRSEILGRMEGIGKEMEEVVKDLERKKVEPHTINRQRRILSRLLDAQRSLQQRDYSRQRESESGKTYFVRSPEEIDKKVMEQKERFSEDLIRARKVGFNEDFLELIRSYFQALTEKESVKQP